MSVTDTTQISIRPETPNDSQHIADIIQDAFIGHPYSNHNEALIVARLREEGGLTISLVAENTGNVIGHIAFSPVQISGNSRRWYGLAPVSVYKSWQRKGIGSLLVQTGLKALRRLDANGCVVLGNPLFYQKFGFVSADKLRLKGYPSEYLMSLAFGSEIPSGELNFHAAFDVCF